MAISIRKQQDLLIKAILNCIAEWKTNNPNKDEPLWVAKGTTVDEIEWQSDTSLNDEVETEFDRLKDEWAAQEYARNRAAEYPNLGDQLDMIYKDNKNSTTTHADAVEVVKAKWPKDNSGPK